MGEVKVGLACDELTYVGVDGSSWARVKALVGGEYGIAIEADSGEASKRGVTLKWSYDLSEQTLAIQCLQKPFLIPCGTVNKRIDDAAARCGIAAG